MTNDTYYNVVGLYIDSSIAIPLMNYVYLKLSWTVPSVHPRRYGFYKIQYDFFKKKKYIEKFRWPNISRPISFSFETISLNNFMESVTECASCIDGNCDRC